MSEDKFTIAVVLGMIGVVVTCAIVFYGTIAAIAIHFIHKYW
jgi:hypothetical protein